MPSIEPASEQQPPTPPPLPAERKTWQFSLRSLMIGMTGFAILSGLFSAFPLLSGIVLGGLWLAISGWLLTGIIFAKGDTRAFCIGAAVVVASTWTGMGGQFLESLQKLAFRLSIPSSGWPGNATAWFKHLLLFGAAVANGYFCIHARRYFERQSAD